MRKKIIAILLLLILLLNIIPVSGSYKVKDIPIDSKESSIVDKNTYAMSLQNGLDNVETISKHIDKCKILVCITTHGASFSKLGVIKHKGIGSTKISSIDKNNIKTINDIVNMFNQVGIKTQNSQDIIKDIWIKGIINSSINTLTTIFD